VRLANILYNNSYRGGRLSHINVMISNEKQSHKIKQLKINRRVSSLVAWMTTTGDK